MAVFGYIFLSDGEERVFLGEQQRLITDFAVGIGLGIDEIVIEQDVYIKKPFGERPEGNKMINGLQPDDVVIVLRSDWILVSAGEGLKLLEAFRKRAISLFCVDLGENISMPSERKLVVSEGSSEIVLKLLNSLKKCENNRYGEAIKAVKRARKKEGKYLGGPVPFGWQVDSEGFFQQHKEQQQIIREILDMRADRWSYRDISVKLKERRNLNLSHEGIRRILGNDRRRKEKLST